MTGHKSAKTLEALFAHPVPANLHWSEVLTMLRRVGTVEPHHHGSYAIAIGGHTVNFKHTNEKQLDKEQVMHLKSFLESAGIGPGHPTPDAAETETFDAPPLIVVINHREAQLWHQTAAGAPVKKADGEVKPHDPHHYRHHLTHHNEDHLKGQRAPEDVEFYKTLVKAIEASPRAIVLGDAKGKSSAMELLHKFIERHHKWLLSRIDAFVDIDLSALTEPKIRDVAGRYWH